MPLISLAMALLVPHKVNNMKKTISIIFTLLISLTCFAGTVQEAQRRVIAALNSGGEGGTTPDASFDLDTVGGTGTEQVYDSIATAWVGAGHDTYDFSSGYLSANSSSDVGTIPGSYFQYSTSYTIYFEYRVDSNDSADYIIDYSSGGDEIYFKHYSTTNTGYFYFRCNYSANSISWTNTGYALDTWHTVYIAINISSQNIDVYIDGSEVSGGSESFGNIADMGTLSSDMTLVDMDDDGQVDLRNLKIYNGIVTP